MEVGGNTRHLSHEASRDEVLMYRYHRVLRQYRLYKQGELIAVGDTPSEIERLRMKHD